jgi:hypothetical protein
MNKFKNLSWWTSENDSAWDSVKAAFKRDWDQTKHDFGGAEPDTKQNVKTTVKQAAGKQTIPPRGVPNYEEIEAGYRFGYGAKAHYSTDYPYWNEDLEEKLRSDWQTAYPNREERWDSDVQNIRTGWDYEQ